MSEQQQFSFATTSFDHLKVYKDLEEAGKWVDMGAPNKDGTVPQALVIYCGDRNLKFQKATEEAFRIFREGRQGKEIDVEERYKLGLSVFVHNGIKNWRNVKDVHGEDIYFSSEAMLAWFEQFPKGIPILESVAFSGKHFRPEANLEDVAKK